MRQFVGKRYWLIGGSEGLGLALAKKLSGAGAKVILSGRDEERLKVAVAEMPGHAEAVPVDVQSDESIRTALETIGEVDGIVFNAGVYWPMTAQEWDRKAIDAMLDTNLMGLVRLVSAVLPGMIARDRGHLVVTGSIAGFRGLPGAIGYAASKAGVVGLTESLYADLRGTGVDVQLVNPGFVNTRMTAKNKFRMPFIMEPDAAARHIFEHMCSDNFRLNFPAPFSSFFRFAQLLPDGLFFRLVGQR
ncbi:SDR family NAD(P)-dependent oxidoreductase [Cereibacter sphaeroides]|uniref:SDR family NAD(P)-dependent oxidoreductase n=1 Tax=Cereibacter sphaeroides TaxID=1063 RepID=UPI001F33795A|nr:SDR family NAD(P)-dependent oxidoreductase [Cereibacter sphaeroides]MCE6951131.1 SDR family NAD(P)-dependent oxidoreductase [Cereibacter sphaeroides]